MSNVIQPLVKKSLPTLDGNALTSNVLSGKTFYTNSYTKLTGTMVNRGAVNTNITTKAQQVTIAQGYHSGSGKVQISSTEQAKIIADNIKSGVTILGITGTSPIVIEVASEEELPDTSSDGTIALVVSE